MVKLWVDQYVKQRAAITGGEFQVEVYGVKYETWDSLFRRPLTPIEETLFVWLNSDSKIAQRFATLTFLEIARLFEFEEYKQIKAHRAKMEELRVRLQAQKQNNTVNPNRPQTVEYNPGLNWWLRVKIFFYLLFESRQNQQSLKEIIRLFLAERYSKTDLQMVIYKWDTRKKGGLSSKLAKWLYKLLRHI